MRDVTPMKHPAFYLHCHLMTVTQNMDLSSKKLTNASVAVLCARCPQRLMLFTVRQTRYQTAQRDGQQHGLATVSSRYLCSENNSADQLHGYRAADLHLCFCICKSRFSHEEAQTAHKNGQQHGLATVSSRYLCSENNSADQLHGYRAADLHLCFCICKSRFSHEEAQTAHKNGQQHGLATVSLRFVNINSYRRV